MPTAGTITVIDGEGQREVHGGDIPMRDNVPATTVNDVVDRDAAAGGAVRNDLTNHAKSKVRDFSPNSKRIIEPIQTKW